MYTHVALNTKTISKKDPVIIPCNYKRRNIVQTWLKGWILSSHFPLRYANLLILYPETHNQSSIPRRISFPWI